MSQRLYLAAQALADWWIPLRGHRELFQETELGQAAAVLTAADEYMFSEEQIARAVLVAHQAGGISVTKAKEIVANVIGVLAEPITETDFTDEQIREILQVLKQRREDILDDDGTGAGT